MDDEPTLTRRTVERLTAGAAAAGSVLLGGAFGAFRVEGEDRERTVPADSETIDLPDPQRDGDVAVERAIARRRSRRAYAADPLSLADVSQLLWAAQGVTESHLRSVDFRAAPSAGATYPLDVFLVVGDPGVEGVAPGVYQYDNAAHRLVRRLTGNVQADLQDAAIDQEWVGAAAADIVITAIDERTTDRYGQRGSDRYVPMEAGHVGENIYLQAESRDLATVAIGAFRDADLLSVLDLDDEHRPLYIYPVGKRQDA
jgi:SagB-type dehydrogenase family enzyme